MNILLIGGGGREHSVAKSLSKSSKITELHCIPGNAGIEKIAKCHNYDISNPVSYTHLTLPTKA